jgi:hypothetical protein
MPGVSFVAALRGSAAQQQQQKPQVRQVPVADPPAKVKLCTPTSGQQQNAGQSVWAPTVNSQHLDNMLRVATVVQQIMTEFNCAVLELDKMVVITRIVLNLMNQNVH